MPTPTPEERRARELAEQTRERSWAGASFLRDLFMGRFSLDQIEPFPIEEPSRPEFRRFYDALREVLEKEVDPVAIDATGEYPPRVVDELRRIGAFGMKIPIEYGGLGLTHSEYVRAMTLVGSYDSSVTALLSAHQAIGVPQPVKLFGSEEQKRRFLPRCARGAISAFALTEPAVGSDPGKLATSATPADDGKSFVLDGRKLWCTNGTLAELLVVMARDSRTGKIDAFVVETDSPGVVIEHRCRFMGLKALANAVIRFDSVVVPRENLIGREGEGLKIALVTLNTGRLTLPASTTGVAKHCLEVCRTWSTARVQWGVPIHRHEAVARKIADVASVAYAMESLAHLVGDLADRDRTDIRLEAAAAKEWNTVRCWELLDETFQVRGGRAYETERSLRARGEAPIGVERYLRDARINLIFEGSSEIMHLFMAREAVDKHLSVAGVLVDSRKPRRERLAALPRIAAFYALWYPALLLRAVIAPRFSRFRALGKHLRFAERSGRRLARAIFHGMLVHGPGLERKQGFLFRAMDIAMEIFALTATVSRAHALALAGRAEAASARELADLFARRARRRIDALFGELFSNDDARAHTLAQEVARGRHLWLEQGAMPLGYSEESIRPAVVGAPSPERRVATRQERPPPPEARA